MRILILLTTLILLPFGCTAQPDEAHLPISNTIEPTPSSLLGSKTEATLAIISTASLTPIPTHPAVGTITPSLTKAIVSAGKDFYFGATPINSQAGGMDGVFYRDAGPDETCAQNYNVFRFYEDGLVMGVSVCDDEATGNFSKGVWPYISKWFIREKIDDTISQGIYSLKEDKIWFTTSVKYPSHAVISDYLGTSSNDRIILDRFTHPNGYQIKGSEAREEYVELDTPNGP